MIFQSFSNSFLLFLLKFDFLYFFDFRSKQNLIFMVKFNNNLQSVFFYDLIFLYVIKKNQISIKKFDFYDNFLIFFYDFQIKTKHNTIILNENNGFFFSSHFFMIIFKSERFFTIRRIA